MKVIEYIKEHGLDALEKNYSIKVNRYVDRVVLNYNQIDSPKHDPIVKECRALILSYPDFNILSRSFDRFFNYGEDQNTKDFDVSKSIVYEKLDGTLINLYYDEKTWHFATRKMAFAEGYNTFGSSTYQSMCLQALNDMDIDFYEFTSKLNKDFTYIFEITSPKNRVVKHYHETKLTHLATRNKLTGDYVDEVLEGFPVPKIYKLDADNIFESLKELPAMDEGYVCAIGSWRIKIKNPSYLAISNLRENAIISEKRICYLVVQNDFEEYLGYFPEDEHLFIPYIDKYESIMLDIKTLWDEVKGIEDQKEFAMKVKDKPYGFVLFQLRKNPDLTISDILSNMNDVKCQTFLMGYK